jgi:hypothetical protein
MVQYVSSTGPGTGGLCFETARKPDDGRPITKAIIALFDPCVILGWSTKALRSMRTGPSGWVEFGLLLQKVVGWEVVVFNFIFLHGCHQPSLLLSKVNFRPWNSKSTPYRRTRVALSLGSCACYIGLEKPQPWHVQRGIHVQVLYYTIRNR